MRRLSIALVALAVGAVRVQAPRACAAQRKPALRTQINGRTATAISSRITVATAAGANQDARVTLAAYGVRIIYP